VLLPATPKCMRDMGEDTDAHVVISLQDVVVFNPAMLCLRLTDFKSEVAPTHWQLLTGRRRFSQNPALW